METFKYQQHYISFSFSIQTFPLKRRNSDGDEERERAFLKYNIKAPTLHRIRYRSSNITFQSAISAQHSNESRSGSNGSSSKNRITSRAQHPFEQINFPQNTWQRLHSSLQPYGNRYCSQPMYQHTHRLHSRVGILRRRSCRREHFSSGTVYKANLRHRYQNRTEQRAHNSTSNNTTNTSINVFQDDRFTIAAQDIMATYYIFMYYNNSTGNTNTTYAWVF